MTDVARSYALRTSRLTLLVGVDAVAGVEFLVPLLLVNGLAEDRVPVHDIFGFFLLRARHFVSGATHKHY